MIKLMIAIPTAGLVSIDFCYSLVSLVGYVANDPPKTEFAMRVATATGSNWIENREVLGKRAIDEGFTHLCFIDDDMVFDPSVVPMLLEHIHAGKDAVCVNYLVKQAEKLFVSKRLDGSEAVTTQESTGLEEIAGSGFGVSIMNVDILRKMPRPWFMPTWNPETERPSTEDLPFWRRAREMGFKLWLDHDASKRVAHLGRKQWFWREAV
jgi:hypothetical protein